MLTSGDIQRILTPGLNKAFMQAYNDTQTVYQDMVTEIPSTKKSETYGWLGNAPQMQEWISERAAQKLSEYGMTLKNKHFEATLSVDSDDLEDDEYGQIKIRAQELRAVARNFYDEKFTEVVEAGTTALAYDGQYFFDTDHQEGDTGAQSNYSASGLPLSAANIKTIIGAMRAFKNDRNKPARIRPTHIMVPGILEFTALEIFDPAALQLTGTPSAKVLSGRLKVIVNDYLDGTGGANAAYYVMDLSKPLKPFIFQNRKPITFVALDKPTDHDNFMRREIYYGVDSRFVMGYGDWKLAYKAKG
jgi:phage major head subunit gpT-like protein